jgi:hypothetical protein
MSKNSVLSARIQRLTVLNAIPGGVLPDPVKFTVSDLSPLTVSVSYQGNPVGLPWYPMPSLPYSTPFDIDLAFTGVALNGYVEVQVELTGTAALKSSFIVDDEITSGSTQGDAMLRKIVRVGDGAHLTRYLCQRLSSNTSNPEPYSIGLVIQHGSYQVPTFIDPKIKNNG